MKKNLLLWICIALLSMPLTAQALTLSLTTNNSIVAPNSTVQIDVVVTGLGNHAAPLLGNFDLGIAYDPTLFSYVGIQYGSGLGDVSLGESTVSDTATPRLVLFSEVSLLEGMAASCTQCVPPYLEDLQNGSLILASLNFTALAPGTGVFDLSAYALGDALGDPLTADLAAGSLTVSIPEPDTLGLLLFGGLILSWVGKFRKFWRT